MIRNGASPPEFPEAPGDLPPEVVPFPAAARRPRFVTVEEALALLRSWGCPLGRHKLYALLRSGAISALGGHGAPWHIRYDSLVRFAQGPDTGPEPQPEGAAGVDRLLAGLEQLLERAAPPSPVRTVDELLEATSRLSHADRVRLMTRLVAELGGGAGGRQ